MITCSICHRFVSNVTIKYNKFTATVLGVNGKCKKCGVVKVNYDDFEELGIEE